MDGTRFDAGEITTARLLQLYLLCVRVLVDAYVFMSPSSEAEFVKSFPRAREKTAWHVPHGPYPVAAVSPQRRAEPRERLSGGANCLLVGFLGDIRPYKNPEALAVPAASGFDWSRN